MLKKRNGRREGWGKEGERVTEHRHALRRRENRVGLKVRRVDEEDEIKGGEQEKK